MEKGVSNIFISHHHKDDASVDGFTSLLGARNYWVRNSSIRVKPENQRRIEEKKVSDATIRRLLRRKLRWARKLVVIVGKETHQRDWVNWEIKIAHQMGKEVIGVYEHGLKDKVEIPENLAEYGKAIVPWRGDLIKEALEGKGDFLKPTGEAFPKGVGANVLC